MTLLHAPTVFLRIFLTLGIILIAFSAHYRNRHAKKPSTSPIIMHYLDTIQNVTQMNISKSYDIIANLPLKQFQFSHNESSSRVHVGVLGFDLVTVIPDAVSVLREHSIFNNKREKVCVRNFHAVDTESLFMHNIGTTQLLISQFTAQKNELIRLLDQVSAHSQILSKLQLYLNQESSAQLKETRAIEEARTRQRELDIQSQSLQFQQTERNFLLQANLSKITEHNKTLEHKERLLYADKLTRDQNKELVRLQQHSQLFVQRKQSENAQKLQSNELKLELHKAKLERDALLEKTRIQVQGKIDQQRENKDIDMLQLQERLKAEHVKIMQALQAIFDNFGRGFFFLLNDRQKAMQLILVIVSLFAGIYISREGIRILGKLIEKKLVRPSLVRETSQTSGLWGFFQSFFFRRANENVHELADIVLRTCLETRVLEIARSTRNALRRGAPYRHLLLYGPPGTGKTMVAKRLARCSGMDYAILSGGDVGPLGSDAVTELHALFQWAKSSPRGVLIFIDEAEAFLGCRASRKTHMSEHMRNALNALLFHTGTQSKKFMLVIATNRPEDLDVAVTDRIDDTLHFELPEEKERVRLLQMYFKEYLGKMPEAMALLKILKAYGKVTEGMSGREIAKMMLYLQSVVHAQERNRVTHELLARVVREKKEEHVRKAQLRQFT